ncbi:hypothetical protein H4S06_000369 [Coemansia sp. BCRC 34490]|nr:hypothetical protein H4S06_000369 [Coemansia sp. BCRC 34490]
MASGFDENEPLFSDHDPNYRDTHISSGVPPPRLHELPRHSTNANRRYPPHPQQQQHQQPIQRQPQMRQVSAGNQMRESLQNCHLSAAAVGDTRGCIYRVASAGSRHGNNKGEEGPKEAAGFIQDLSSANWLRMASDRDDPRGRQANSRLCEIGLVQEIDRVKSTLSRQVAAGAFDAARRQTNMYADLIPLPSSPRFVGASAVALAHLDFLVSVVAMYLGRGGGALPSFRFADLGSERGGCAEYVLWRAATSKGRPAHTVSGEADAFSVHGWYFDTNGHRGLQEASAVADAGSGLSLGDMHEQCDAANRLTVVAQADASTAGGGSAITSEANIDAFVRQVQAETSRAPGDSQAAGIDLVVGEACYSQDDLAMDHEKGQYTFTLAQTTIALQVLRPGGSFVFRLFDITTPPTAEMLFVLSACFESVDIVRSLVSRPTSSERFVVCRRLRAIDTQWAALHMRTALNRINSGNFKLSHILSWTKVMDDHRFVSSLREANTEIAHAQLAMLKGVAEITLGHKQVVDRSLEQKSAATRCLDEWGLLRFKK